MVSIAFRLGKWLVAAKFGAVIGSKEEVSIAFRLGKWLVGG